MTMEENLDRNFIETQNVPEGQIEKERFSEELERIDKVRKIMESKYPPYGVLRDFINHLASTEKFFVLAGIKNFGGDEIMDMFIRSENEIMAEETGISKEVFNQMKEVFVKTYETVSEISEVADELEEKYKNDKDNEKILKFIQYLERELIMIVEISEKSHHPDFEIDKEKEQVIESLIIELSENDKVEMDRLRKLYEEFKDELNN